MDSSAPMATRDRVAIGASSGGVAALKHLVAALPADLPAALCVVLHISPQSRSVLPQILSRAGPLPAVAAEDGMALQAGRIHVAPPDHHLLVEHDTLRVLRGPPENRHRPAIDPLLRSLAWSHGPRAVGVVLSGGLDDGTAGLWALKSCGGTTVVQEPDEAENPDMPNSALLHNRIDHRLRLNGIAALLTRLAHEPIAPAPPQPPPPGLADEIAFTRLDGQGLPGMRRLGALSPFTCPSCRGALWELDEGAHLRYRCHTGHAFSNEALLAGQASAAEEGLYVALRAVEEKAGTLRRLAERSGQPSLRDDYRGRADQLDASARALRALLAGTVP
jgi:two-component system chemotaxis response regulator CheB